MIKKLLLIQTIIFSISFGQTVWWVDLKNGDDSYTGTTEATAFKTIYQALKTNSWSSGDTIKVNPSLASDGSLSYYDFGNNELTLDAGKDFVLIGTGGADQTIFDAESKNRHFIIRNTTSNTIIKGITFKNGYTDNWPGGGSIFLEYSNAAIQFIDCIWDNNYVTQNEGGGAIIIRDGATPSFTNCVFKNNYVDDSENGNNGGAVFIQWPGSKTDLEATIVFKKTKFINNYLKVKHSSYGGAVHSQRNVEFENCLFVNNRSISNNGGTGSEAWGGAIYFDAKYWNGSSNDGGVMKIVNTTFHGNYIQSLSSNYGSMYGGTISYGQWDESANSKTYIFNTIVSGSMVLIEQTERITTDSNQLKNEIIGTGNSNGYKLTIDYSNVQGSSGMSWAGDNIYEVVPVYKDSANGDYSLSDKSPMIGAGVATWDDEQLNAPIDDILGVTRGSEPDMGAYENSLDASTAPMPVSGLIVTRATNGASLSWNVVKEYLGSTTDASNIEYQIYQDGTNVAQTTSTSYSATGLTNGTVYSFSVSAKSTNTSTEGATSKAVSVTPKYSGPKWYVAASGGSPSTTSDYNLGSTDVPLNHISSAIELAATGDTIVMMKGTHSGSNNRGINFSNNEQYVIMGDPTYPADQTIIDAGGRDRHFTFDNGEDTTFQIIGLTLYNGKTTSSGGGSIKIESAAVKLKNIIFLKNYSTGEDWSSSGAVFITNNGKTIIDGCTFDGNYIYGEEMGNAGGAIFAQNLNGGTDTLIIKNSIFKNNYVKAKDDAWGGAIAIYHYQAVIENNLFYDNYVYSALGSPNSRNASGGAVYLFNPNYWDNSTQTSKSLLVMFRNNTVVNNWVTSERSDSYLEGAGVEFSGHDAGEYYSFNNIIWGNKLLGRTNHNQIYLNYNENNIKFNDDYNDIQNLEQHNQYSRFGDYSVSYEPEFSDSANGDFTLTDQSLLLGSGTASFEGFAAPSKDILGNTRPNPAGSSPDMGAYENSLSKSPYPKQVQNLTAVGGSGQITLNWDANETIDNVAKYNIYQHTGSFSVSSTYLLDNTTATTYTITGLDNGTRYYFRVSAVNTDELEGSASNSVDLTPAYSGPVWWVATDGNDSNEGSSGSPFASISKAVEKVAKGDTVILKEGTYTGTNNREITFNHDSPEIVIKSEKGAQKTIIDAGNTGQRTIFKFHRPYNASSDDRDRLDSTFQIIGLQFTGATRSAIWVDRAGTDERSTFLQPKFSNCIFYNNRNTENNGLGGAVFINNGSPIFESCVFDSNYVNGSGGAIGIRSDLATVRRTHIRSSAFTNNMVHLQQNTQSWDPNGSAIVISGNATATILDCIFENNITLQESNEHANSGRGAIVTSDSDWSTELSESDYIVIIDRCIIRNNTVQSTGNTYGAGIAISKPAKISNNLIVNNKMINNGQATQGLGAGMYVIPFHLYNK
jgi:hypothetical protein